MNKMIFPVISGIVIAIIGIVLAVNPLQQEEPMPKMSGYVESNRILQQNLAKHDLHLSSPIKLSRSEDIEKYCSFFTDEEKQNLVEYCTSTELKDKNDNFLGNIHMVGHVAEPKIIMVLIQTDSEMSQLDSVMTVYDTVVQSLVCDCWTEQKPGNLENIAQWVDGLRQFHLGDTKPHSKSSVVELEGKSLQLELTTNEDGYLWQFFIYY